MVLQRWQTVYLLISVITLALAAFMPAIGAASACPFSCPGSVAGIYHLLCAVTALLLLVAIFKFKALKLQRTLCSCGALMSLAACALTAIAYAQAAAPELNLAALLPVLALICALLAKGRIQKDYRLLHDSERLR